MGGAPPAPFKYAIGVEYDGGGFCGWQSQPAGCGAQNAVEAALSAVANAPARALAAGRTDAGAHATQMIAHFASPVLRQPSAWVAGGNRLLPPAARLLWAKPVGAGFHARHRAQARHYRYVVLNRPQSSALLAGRVGFCPQPLNLPAMQKAATLAVGERDFSAFRAAACQAKTPVRRLHMAQCARAGELIVFDFRADGFLHNMARNLTGALLQVGRGRAGLQWFEGLFARRSRPHSLPIAPACGLYFCGAQYAAAHNLPPYRYPAIAPQAPAA